MTDVDVLFAAVLADPADDTPRLVLADALDEAGDAGRAELIRVQCELARYTPPRLVRAHVIQTQLRPLVGGEVTVAVRPDQTAGLQPGHRIDVEMPTSRLTARKERDLVVVQMTDDVAQHVLLCHLAEPWPERAPYEGLLRRQYEMLAEDFDRYAYDPGREQEDRPGVAASPSFDDQFPSVRTHGFRGRQVLRRGFVEAVECEADEFVKHAGRLFAAHPVARVRLSGFSPLNMVGEDGEWWHLFRQEYGLLGPDPLAPARLPAALYDRLPRAQFNSPVAAHAAVEKAALEYGRWRAGVEPLVGVGDLVRVARPDAVPARHGWAVRTGRVVLRAGGSVAVALADGMETGAELWQADPVEHPVGCDCDYCQTDDVSENTLELQGREAGSAA